MLDLQRVTGLGLDRSLTPYRLGCEQRLYLLYAQATHSYHESLRPDWTSRPADRKTIRGRRCCP